MGNERKKVVVFFDRPGVMEYPLDVEMYLEAHIELAELIEERGGDYYFVRGGSSHLGGGKFSQSWKFNNGTPIEAGEVAADIIYDKGSPKVKLEPGIDIVNSQFMNAICEDKFKTYELFPELSPKTVIATNQDELMRAVTDINSEMIVIKPTVGYGGAGVEVLSRKKAKTHKIGPTPILVQQFIDTSGGIKGLTEGVHDLRLVIIGGEIITAMVRKPPKGSLVANLKIGGSLTVINLGNLPSSAVKLAKNVDSIFKKYPKRVYSIDMAYEGTRPYLIELNSRPGLWNRARGKAAIDFQEKLVTLLLS